MPVSVVPNALHPSHKRQPYVNNRFFTFDRYVYGNATYLELDVQRLREQKLEKDPHNY